MTMITALRTYFKVKCWPKAGYICPRGAIKDDNANNTAEMFIKFAKLEMQAFADPCLYELDNIILCVEFTLKGQ
jgi:hypothetical protein